MQVTSLDDFLCRTYPLAPILWDTSKAAGTLLQTLSFPYTLLNEYPQLVDKMKDWGYFRAGVRLTFRVNATKFLYGSLMCSWEPNANFNELTSISRNIYVSSGYPHIIISASSANSISVDIPFVYPTMGISLVGPLIPNSIGEVDIAVLAPLVDISANTGTATLLVTAQFLEPRVWMPFSNTITLTPPTAKENFEPIIAQSLLVKARKGYAARAQEASEKAEKGVVSSFLDSTMPIANVLEKVPVVGEYSKIYKTVADIASPFLSMFGLSKPADVSGPSVMVVDPYRYMNMSGGSDPCNVLGLSQEMQISTVPNVGGISEDEMSLTRLCGTPSLYSVGNVIATTQGKQVRITENPSSQIGSNNTYTICDFVAHTFALKSGSCKVKFYFFASQFHNVRIRISWKHPNALAGTDNALAYNRIVDIAGDTECDILLPWCYTETKMPIMDFGALYLDILTWSVPDSSLSVPITYAVYKSFCSDVHFSSQKFMSAIVAQSDPRLDFSKDFEKIHPDVTGFACEAMNSGEKVLTLRDVMHRYLPYVGNGNDYIARPGTNYSLSLANKNVNELYLLLYSFWRGSVRVRYMIHPAAQATLYAISSLRTWEETSANNASTVSASCYIVKPYLDAEIPYMSRYFYQPTFKKAQSNIAWVTPTAPDLTAKVAKFMAFGDDISCHFIKGPPPVQFKDRQMDLSATVNIQSSSDYIDRTNAP